MCDRSAVMKSRVHVSQVSRAVEVAIFAFLTCTLAPTAFASTITPGSARFTVTRVPTNVSSSDLTAPGSATDSDYSPAQGDLTYCSWLNGTPGVPALRRSSPYYPGTKCHPLIVGKSFGLLQSPQNAHFQYEVLRVARENPKTHAVSVGPVLVTFGDGAGARPSAAAADGWIWVYVPTKGRADVLRFSSTSGALKQRISIPSMHEPVIAANDDGLFLGWSNQGGLGGSVYFVSVGSSQVQLVQATKLFTFKMQGSAHSMTVVEAPRAIGPFVAYRLTSIQK